MQGVEELIHTGPCATDRGRQDKDLHFVIPKYQEDGKRHLGCAACTLLPAACPPGEYVLDCRHVVQGPYVDYIGVSLCRPTRHLERKLLKIPRMCKDFHAMRRRV